MSRSHPSPIQENFFPSKPPLVRDPCPRVSVQNHIFKPTCLHILWDDSFNWITDKPDEFRLWKCLLYPGYNVLGEHGHWRVKAEIIRFQLWKLIGIPVHTCQEHEPLQSHSKKWNWKKNSAQNQRTSILMLFTELRSEELFCSGVDPCGPQHSKHFAESKNRLCGYVCSFLSFSCGLCVFWSDFYHFDKNSKAGIPFYSLHLGLSYSASFFTRNKFTH